MPATTNLPTQFEKFDKSRKLIRNSSVRQKLNRFSYRYRLARSFAGMTAPEVGETLTGYDALMKVFLTYTAYELIIGAATDLQLPHVGSKSTNTVNDENLIRQIAENESLKHYVIKTSGKNNRATIEDTMALKNFNIAAVVFALRNGVSHGDLTPTVVGIKTKADKQMLFALSNALLNYCDSVFSDCLKGALDAAAE